MRAEQFLCFNNNRLYGEVLAPAICILAASGLADARLRRWYCYCFFIVLCTFHGFWGFCVVLCFGLHYFVSFLVLQSS